MSSWIFFALLAPLFWAFTNVIDASLRSHYIKSDFALTWIFAMSRLPFVIFFFLWGGFEIPSLLPVLIIFVGGMFWTIPFALYFKALEADEPSRIALFLQFTPLFTLLIAFFAIGERLTEMQGLAFILLLVGGTLAAVKRIDRKWHSSIAFFLIALATLMWAISDVIFKKYEVFFSNFFSAFAFYFFGSFIVALLMMLHSRGREKISRYFSHLSPRAWFLIALSMLLGISGSMAFAYALTLGKASLTSVIIGVQPLLVLLLGVFLSRFFREFKKEDVTLKTLLIKVISFAFVLAGLAFLQI